MGPCAGGAVYSPAMTDYVFMTKLSSYMFITGRTHQGRSARSSPRRTWASMAHAAKSGVCHFACESDADSIEQIKIS